jgi:SSS family solute:Na+ symporter
MIGKNSIDLLFVTVYIIIITFYGLKKAKLVNNSADFMVAGRSLGLFVLIGTLVMTEINTATMIGMSVFSYKAGIYATLIALANIVAFGSYTLVVAKRWSRSKLISITQMLDERYGKKMQFVASVMVIFALLLFSTAYLKSAALVFSVGLGIDLVWTSIIISLVVLLFTSRGGLISVSYTNLISFLLTIVIVPLIFAFAWHKAHVLGGLSSVFEPKYLSWNMIGMWNDSTLSFEFIFTIWMLVFLMYMQSPWYAQYMFASKNEKTAFWGVAIASLLIFLLYWAFMMLSAFARVGFPDLADSQMAIPSVIANWLPVGFRGLTLAVIFSICQSTMATIWNNTATIITNDIYHGYVNPKSSDERILFITRLITLFIAVFTIFASIYFVDIIYQVMFSANIFLVALFFPVIGGFLWWGANGNAAWITILLAVVGGWTIFFAQKYGNHLLPEFFRKETHDWLFLYCCVIYPAIAAIGIILSFFMKDSEEVMKKKIVFYDKIGAPWLGKNEYLKAKALFTV